MEEFLEENEKDFLKYIEFKKQQDMEIDRINRQIKKIKSDIIANNLTVGTAPYLEIEKRRTIIQELNVKIANIGVGKKVNEVKESSQSEKEISNFKSEVEIERLKKEKQQLENEVKEIMDACKKNIQIDIVQDQINTLQKTRKTIEKRITERKEMIEELINRKITQKEEVLSEISNRREEMFKKIKNEIQEKEKTLVNVNDIEFDDEDSDYLYKLKQKTTERLEKELQELKNTLQVEKKDFRDIYNNNKNKLIELKQLREDLNSNDLSKLTSYLGLQQEEKKEEKKEEPKVSDKKETLESEIVWVPDKIYGGWKIGVIKENKSKNIIRLVKEKINKIKGKFNKNVEYIPIEQSINDENIRNKYSVDVSDKISINSNEKNEKENEDILR